MPSQPERQDTPSGPAGDVTHWNFGPTSRKPGKLRLMYEANPMGWLIEQAGGAATNGRQRILDIQPTQLHERVSVILGSKNEVERVTSYHSTL